MSSFVRPSLLLLLAFASSPTSSASARGVEAIGGAIGDDAIAFPFQRLGGWQLDPVVRLRLELEPRELRNGTMGWFIDGSIASHQRLSVGLTSAAGGLYRYQHRHVFYVDTWFGVGLGWLFLPDDAYEIRDDGSFEAARNHGRARGLMDMGLGMGFPLPGIEGRPLSLFASYQMVVEMPFANGIPLAPHTVLSLGVRWSFGDARRGEASR